MKSILLLIFCATASCYSQKYECGAFIMREQTVRFPCEITVTDSIVTIGFNGGQYQYQVVERPVPGLIDTDYGGYSVRFMIDNSFSGRLHRFKYTHVINVTTSAPEIMPEAGYFCRLLE